jgi:hypothetical protein
MKLRILSGILGSPVPEDTYPIFPAKAERSFSPALQQAIAGF